MILSRRAIARFWRSVAPRLVGPLATRMPEPRGQNLRGSEGRGATGDRPIAEQWGERLTMRRIRAASGGGMLNCGRDLVESGGDLHKRVTLILD
jgi:hypothetical protein